MLRKNPISKLELEKIEYIIDDIRNGNLIIDHPLQRYSGNWSKEQKGNLIRRVLHDGQFLPILICTQYDEYGCEVKYLIDGVQRMTTFEEYMRDEFAISKNTIDYEVSYDGYLYETKQLQSGKFSLKRDRKKNLIPVLDENGNMQKRIQTIDIRGLKYSELPPELQDKIKRYCVSVQFKLECTDEDIQIEILDYNNGTKMNDAQIGKNRLGVEFAKIVTELSNHPFILNKCGFTPDNRIKGVIARAINEALMLVNFGTDEWVSSHKDLCRKLSNWLTIEHTNKLKEMFDDLDSILPEDDDIKKYLTLKEFFVVMANYKHFLDLDENYKKECYAMFINDFVRELSLIKNIPTGEVDDDGNDIYGSFKTVYMNGTKQKGAIQERLDKMNEMMEEYVAAHCDDMKEDDEELPQYNNEDIDSDIEDEFTLDGKNDELQEYAQNFISDAEAIKPLIMISDCPYNSFEKDTLNKFVDWYKKYGNNQLLQDCLFYKIYVDDAGIDNDDPNLALYIYAAKYIYTTGNDIDITDWLIEFKNTAFAEIDSNENNDQTSNSTVVLKQSEIIQNIQNITKERKDNVVC